MIVFSKRSDRLIEMAAAASAGMKDEDVRDLCQLTQSTWYRIQHGERNVGKDKLIRFALGMKLSVEDVLAAVEETTEAANLAEQALTTALTLAELSAADRVEIMSLYRQKVERMHDHADRSSAAA